LVRQNYYCYFIEVSFEESSIFINYFAIKTSLKISTDCYFEKYCSDSYSNLPDYFEKHFNFVINYYYTVNYYLISVNGFMKPMI
jgi:hypothetical protein